MRPQSLYFFITFTLAANIPRGPSSEDKSIRKPERCSIFDSPVLPQDDCLHHLPDSFLEDDVVHAVSKRIKAKSNVLDDAFQALSVMQDEFFASESGTWPTAIDWTAAVLQTHLVGLMSTLSDAFTDVDLAENTTKANIIDLYFSQTIASYFGQDHFSIRLQAYDDMLWVVLGWVETLNFIEKHSSTHYSPEIVGAVGIPEINEAFEAQPWYGNYWSRAFAHRARIFWELASHGWGTDQCDGGMNWNPHEIIYKNAITNELWIAASIQMYLHFPGDDITTPWMVGAKMNTLTKDPRFLKAAIEGYKWLLGSKMTNKHGLFVDGYHISGRNGSTQCDQRNDMIFTYNQGVLLTGQRGLWAATGSPSYLDEGHALIQNVIRATGWDLERQRPKDSLKDRVPGSLPSWQGLGRYGVIEEMCDRSGTCSQNGHTFKGIFFHHLTHFCTPLFTEELDVIKTRHSSGFDEKGFDKVAAKHAKACREYIPWLRHNAQAALGTRNKYGVFGTWWTIGLFDQSMTFNTDVEFTSTMVDYRNHPIIRIGEWGNGSTLAIPGVIMNRSLENKKQFAATNAKPGAIIGAGQHVMGGGHSNNVEAECSFTKGDLNDRGRGRTVESHSGGMAVLRAWWEISQI